MNTLVAHRPERMPVVQACQVLGLNRSSVYARRKGANNDHLEPRRSRQSVVQPRALSETDVHVAAANICEPHATNAA